MCGIVGYNGKKKNSIDILINGLKALEYRGYDSAGIAVDTGDYTLILKSQGKIENLERKIDYSLKSSRGIGHTRWATHGIANEINSHPHQVGEITIVHNGIIENYKELKKMLSDNGYLFKSQTDTEVACALIDYFYNQTGDIKLSLSKFIDTVKGAYALGIMVNGDNNIYSIRKDAPLIIASGKDGNLIASDIVAVNGYADKILYLDTDVIAQISSDSVKLFDRNLSILDTVFEVIPEYASNSGKGGYEHFMLKEIHEQPRVFKDTTSPFLENKVDSLRKKMPNFSKYSRIDIVACGSAYHTGLVGKNLIEEFADIPVNVEIASEYRYKKNFYDSNALVVIVSQSGETADSLAALRKAKNDKIDTMAIVNVPNSSIAREADFTLLTKAGPEVAVATTKAYSAQVATFGLIAIYMGIEKRNMTKEEIKQVFDDIKQMPVLIENTINSCNYKEVAEAIYKREDIFFIGRGIDYALALEGSLKLKEISYIGSQAYAAGELKHGTISLINDGTPVIGIITDDGLDGILKEKTISNIEEVKSRGAKVVVVTNDSNIKDYDYTTTVTKVHKILQPLLTILPLQLIAYEVARLRNCSIDKPKNLAKSVTVE